MNEINNRRSAPFFTPGMIGAVVAAIILAAALFVWAPWDDTRTADNTAPGVTTGQGSNTPGAASPTAPAPAPAPQN